jgi:hypothetical protein
VGKIVGMPRQDGDPANLSRADLVYPQGTMHPVSSTVGASSALVLDLLVETSSP